MNVSLKERMIAGPLGPVITFFPTAFLIFFLCIFTVPLRAEGADTSEISALRELLSEKGVPPEEADRIAAVCLEALEREIPLPMLVPRIEEGLAKGIPVHVLIRALKNETGLLVRARTVILQVPGAEEFRREVPHWQRTANLLSAGISPVEVRALIGLSVSRPEIYRPLTALYTALIGWGLSEDEGMQVAAAVAASGMKPDEYQFIPSLFSQGRRKAIPADKMVRRIVTELPQVKTVRELENFVLQERR